ncbi:histidine phosphatase family protein [Paracraurococcus lichenis]|uniref:Histidine phosphatase family protein n=1 Tax=Paracraurococcus lichenis TaxID=3064888 RepID=A0ABT9E4X9_9PROT|nr:histidine phosphatase family protein [Paracraurococcus sp. LOR1-02]MDO9711235.1 histidine phosphatase family protein [Paracraurococcus sp. LOR1-02]
MATGWFVTHPEVAIDPAVAVPDWGLSEVGRRRAALLAARPWAPGLVAVFSSAERKARETAAPLAARLGLPVLVREALGENDRSATGYLPGAEFEATADRFFARPEESIRGWERAVDAQARIAAAVAAALAEAPPGDLAIIAHGAVGALLRCRLAGLPISRAEDQPPGGGGHCFAFDRSGLRLLTPWRRIEEA